MIDTKELLKLAGQSFDPYFTFILLRKRGQFQSKKIDRLVKSLCRVKAGVYSASQLLFFLIYNV